MSNKRYKHSICVAEMSQLIAKKNHLDSDKAYLSGLVHDIAREFHKERSDSYLQRVEGLSSSLIEKRILHHGPIGSLFLEDKFGITDSEVLEAVKYHSVGNSKLSKIAKVVYVADYISLDRIHITDTQREYILNKDLNSMVVTVAEMCCAYLLSKGEKIVEETKYMINEIKGADEKR